MTTANLTISARPWHCQYNTDGSGTLRDSIGNVIASFKDSRNADYVLEQIAETNTTIWNLTLDMNKMERELEAKIVDLEEELVKYKPQAVEVQDLGAANKPPQTVVLDIDPNEMTTDLPPAA